MYLIALSQANDSQRDAIQAIVKAHADAWWHELPDIWVAGGQDAAYWTSLIKPVLLLSSAAVIVFKLPPKTERAVSWTRLSHEQTTWLWETYAEMPQPPLVPKLPKVPTLPPGIPKAR
jgi:hypothetical protein